MFIKVTLAEGRPALLNTESVQLATPSVGDSSESIIELAGRSGTLRVKMPFTDLSAKLLAGDDPGPAEWGMALAELERAMGKTDWPAGDDGGPECEDCGSGNCCGADWISGAEPRNDLLDYSENALAEELARRRSVAALRQPVESR